MHELEPTHALIIGDFGLGSDAPILLDYRYQPDPAVIRLSWKPAKGSSKPATTWSKIADSLDEFAQQLGLAKA